MKRERAAAIADDRFIVREVAEIFRVSDRTIRLWINIGKLPSFRVGRRHLVRRADVEALLKAADE